MVDFTTWGTKTPFASIRRIVQTNNEFFRIQPGLWALKDYEKKVLDKFDIIPSDSKSVAEFTHAYYQGIIVEIGNIRKYFTYVPPQDKNKKFLGQNLSQLYKIAIEETVVEEFEVGLSFNIDTQENRKGLKTWN